MTTPHPSSESLDTLPAARLQSLGMGIDFDPLEARQLDDPYPIYRALRDDAPCQQAPSGVWTVSRYEDVMRVLKTPEIFSSRAMLSVLLRIARDDSSGPSLEGLYFMARAWWKIRMSPTAIVWARAMIGEDGESHHQLRTIVNRAFTPQRVAAHEAPETQPGIHPLHPGFQGDSRGRCLNRGRCPSADE